MHPEQPGHLDMQDFRKALDVLPPDQREALVLVGAAGFSYEEAAAISGCAVGTIKSRVNRARSKLTELLSVVSPARVRARCGDGGHRLAHASEAAPQAEELKPMSGSASASAARGSACWSKNSTWLTIAFTASSRNGLGIRNVGSGPRPVVSRSGKAVTNITGTAKLRRMSLTASRPELPSAKRISAMTRPGF